MSVKCHVCGFENEAGVEICNECGVTIDGTLPFAAQTSGEASSPHIETSENLAAVETPESKVVDVNSETDPGSCRNVKNGSNNEVVVHKDNIPVVFGDSAGRDDDSKLAESGNDNSISVESGNDDSKLAESGNDDSINEKSDTDDILAISVCPACCADIDEADFYCSICGINIKNYVSAEDLLNAAFEKPEPDGDVLFRLTVVTGHDKGAIHDIRRKEALLGRALDNDIVLASDGYSSGRHSKVIFDGGKLFVEDLDSTNGTFLRVKGKIELQSGDEIKIGQSIFRIEEHTESTEGDDLIGKSEFLASVGSDEV